MHGFGKLIWPNGKSYEGEFAYDQREGFGILRGKSGKKYIGNWSQNHQHGSFKVIENDGSSIEAFYSNGHKLK